MTLSQINVRERISGLIGYALTVVQALIFQCVLYYVKGSISTENINYKLKQTLFMTY